MQLFYNPEIKADTRTFTFDKEESRHIIKVLRKKDRDILQVTNGAGMLYETAIILASDSKCTVEIISATAAAPAKYTLHLAVAPTKMNDRYEWFLEKATEIGISEITPIICERSERKIIKTDRFDKIILSAMKQSNQCYLPKLREPIAYKDFIKSRSDAQLYIAHCEPNDKRSLKETIAPGGSVTILIGPEGDFTEKEIQLAIENKYIPISLGTTRLRTETAAIVACHSAAFVNE